MAKTLGPDGQLATPTPEQGSKPQYTKDVLDVFEKGVVSGKRLLVWINGVRQEVNAHQDEALAGISRILSIRKAQAQAQPQAQAQG